MLTGEQDPPGSGNGGLLLTDRKYADFELLIDMNPDWGPDTGVFFRCTDQGAGFQMYLDYHDGGNVGHLRGARIRCVDKYPKITTWINGVKVCHFDGETSTHPGYDKDRVFGILGRTRSIGLQVHGGIISTISDTNQMGTKWIGSDGWVFVVRGRLQASEPRWTKAGFDPGSVQVEQSPGLLGYVAHHIGRVLRWDAEPERFFDD